MGKLRVRNFSYPPPPLQDRKIGQNVFALPPTHSKGLKLIASPPHSEWLKRQAPVLILPQNFVCPPPPPFHAAWLKLFFLSPFSKAKTCPAPLLFCSPPPPPLPVFKDRSLRGRWEVGEGSERDNAASIPSSVEEEGSVSRKTHV